MAVLTEREREEKGRGEELRKGGSSSFTLGRKRKVGTYVALFA